MVSIPKAILFVSETYFETTDVCIIMLLNVTFLSPIYTIKYLYFDIALVKLTIPEVFADDSNAVLPLILLFKLPLKINEFLYKQKFKKKILSIIIFSYMAI